MNDLFLTHGNESTPARWTRRQVAVRLTAVGLAAGPLATILAREVSGQEASPAGGEPGRCLDATPAPSPAATADATTAAMPEATPVADRCVTVEMYDIYFEPNVVTMPADTPVTLAFPNEGASNHNFSVTDHGNPDLPNLNISVDVASGEAMRITLQAPAGKYYFYCNVPGHEAAGMVGYLDVKEDAEVSTSTATVTPVTG